MHTTNRTRRGLDADAPERGIGRDAYEVACTAAMLCWHVDGRPAFEQARHAVTLHRLSGVLHRYSERMCNEDLTCPTCSGDGTVLDQQPKTGAPCGCKRGVERDNCPTCEGTGQVIDFARIRAGKATKPCRACAGHGNTLGRRIERARQDARDIAEHYGLVAYFQTDPRGCALYLLEPPTHAEIVRSDCRDSAAWLDANYSRGHAVVRLGR